jgi:phage baseplate assembly protein W
MYDLFHEWGADLAVGSGGDIALASGSDMISQRVCRRLLTNPGDNLWNLDYGGGLARFIGQPARSTEIEAVITSQLLLEAAVPTSPPPQVTTTVADVANGYVIANISYVDPTSQNAVTLNVSTG